MKAALRARVLDPVRDWRLRRRLAGPRLLRAFGAQYPEATFVEIGANDGEQHDHLRPLLRSRRWRGVMVEPVPYVFERLRRNYGELEGVTLANVAIADRDGTLPFYHLAQLEDPEREGLPSWYDALGSFSRETVLEHGSEIADIERRLLSIEVPSLTFESLCERYGLEQVDLLLIDTEGYDWEILKHIDFRARHPRLVIYEHFHLAPDVSRRCGEHLEAQGYETMAEGFDTFCLDPSPEDPLTAAWRRLEPAVPAVSAHDLDS